MTSSLNTTSDYIQSVICFVMAANRPTVGHNADPSQAMLPNALQWHMLIQAITVYFSKNHDLLSIMKRIQGLGLKKQIMINGCSWTLILIPTEMPKGQRERKKDYTVKSDRKEVKWAQRVLSKAYLTENKLLDEAFTQSYLRCHCIASIHCNILM